MTAIDCRVMHRDQKRIHELNAHADRRRWRQRLRLWLRGKSGGHISMGGNFTWH